MWLYCWRWTWNGTPTSDFFLSPSPSWKFPAALWYSVIPGSAHSDSVQESNTPISVPLYKGFSMLGDAIGDKYLLNGSDLPLIWPFSFSQKVCSGGNFWGHFDLDFRGLCLSGWNTPKLIHLYKAILCFVAWCFLKYRNSQKFSRNFIYVVYNPKAGIKSLE